jgi:hypothetical protein
MRDHQGKRNMKRTLLAAAALAAAMMGASALEAQVFTPTYTSPRLTNDIGIYLNDGPGSLGVEGIWRGGPLGLRVGYIDAGGGSGGLIGIGAELRNALPMAAAPMALAFVAGAQGALGDNGGVGVQGGLSAGYTFLPQGMAITPYIHPRLALVRNIGPSDDFGVEVLADLGFDVELANRMIVRFGANLGGIGSSWGVGLAWRQ